MSIEIGAGQDEDEEQEIPSCQVTSYLELSENLGFIWIHNLCLKFVLFREEEPLFFVYAMEFKGR